MLLSPALRRRMFLEPQRSGKFIQLPHFFRVRHSCWPPKRPLSSGRYEGRSALGRYWSGRGRHAYGASQASCGLQQASHRLSGGHVGLPPSLRPTANVLEKEISLVVCRFLHPVLARFGLAFRSLRALSSRFLRQPGSAIPIMLVSERAPRRGRSCQRMRPICRVFPITICARRWHAPASVAILATGQVQHPSRLSRHARATMFSTASSPS